MISEILWRPDKARQSGANMVRFLDLVNARRLAASELTDFWQLWRFSKDNPEAFWSLAWEFCGVIGRKGSAPYLVEPTAMPGAKFFPAGRLNFAVNLMYPRLGDQSAPDADDPAIIFRGEDKLEARLSWRELRRNVHLYRQVLGCEGTRVAAIMPNIPETVIAMLAVASKGAVWSSCSPDFGVRGVLDRFRQIEPDTLIAVDGYYYGGKTFALADKLEAISAGLPSVRQIVIVDYIGEANETAKRLNLAVTWAQLGRQADPEEIQVYETFDFNHPLYILFSSGTTGQPKCIVHGAGGTLLQHLKEHQLHCDVKPGDRMFYFTTCGWMMWNWLVSGLASGATLLLYDGAPFYPDGHVLFDFAEQQAMTLMGVSAKYIDALRQAGLRPRETHRLDALRLMTSTGSPLSPAGFDYVRDAVKPDMPLASISGGTDIVSCFVLGNPMLPVRRGEIQGPGLGMDVDVVDDQGRHIVGQKGELVCRSAFPSMPLGFWNDPDGTKYKAAYFERIPGYWHHGDFAEITPSGGFILHGRSDATLNPGGVRIGTAELYAVVESLPDIREALAVGQNWQNDVRIILFVVPSPGVTLDDALCAHIKQQIRIQASPRHVPAIIIAVPDLPRTKSGKISELAVRDLIHGVEVTNRDALANPEALDFFRNLSELKPPAKKMGR